MKIRTGFVSNSSSSSFVVFGFKEDVLPTSEEERRKLIEKHGTEYQLKNLKKFGVDDTWHDLLCNSNLFGLEDIGYLSDDGNGVIGYVIADVSSDGDYLGSQEISFEEVMEAVEKLRKKLNITAKPKLYTGTRAS